VIAIYSEDESIIDREIRTRNPNSFIVPSVLLTSGRWYYEVKLRTNGVMQIGKERKK
jgi:hypothetical protein